MRKPLSIPVLLLAWICLAGDAARAGEQSVAEYNMPAAAATSELNGDAVMQMMETPVKPEVLAAFKKAHPASLWLFGEDRQRAVRRGIVPAHWFDVIEKHWKSFVGTARPGEFYVFQVCVLAGEKPLEKFVPNVLLVGQPAAKMHPISRPLTIKPGEV